MKGAEAYLAVDFVVSGPIIEARLDATMNSDQKRFPYNTKAFFQVFTQPAALPILVASSDGNISTEGAGTETIEEVVTFDDTDQAEVGLPITQIVSYSWLGQEIGAVTALGGTSIKSAQVGVGCLRVTYLANFQRYAVYLPTRTLSEYPVLVSIEASPIAGVSGARTSLMVDFYEPIAGQDLCGFYLTVKNVCNSQIIAGATVTLDGHYAGLTDTHGQVYLGRLLVGSTHLLRIDKSGFRAFEGDFTVPEPGSEEDCP